MATPSIMKALVKRKPEEGYACEDMAVPEPKGDEVRYDVTWG